MAALTQEAVRRYTWVYLLVCLAPSISGGDSKTDTAIREVNACYDQCKSSYRAVYNLALAPLGLEKFVASQKCDAVTSANYTCKKIADVHLCYRNCDLMATQYLVTYSPTQEYNVVEQLYWEYCSVDEMNCRAMDSYYCEASFNFRLCDNNLARYIECITSVQRARQCSVLSAFSCYPSQLVVQSLIFTSTKYCSMAPVTDLVAKNSGNVQYAVLQACESVIDFLCLGYLGYTGSGISVSFQSNASCKAFSQAISCIMSTVNSTLQMGSTQYVAPCRLLPDAERTLQTLTDQLRSMMPARCSGQTSCLSQRSNTSDADLKAMLQLPSSQCRKIGNQSDDGGIVDTSDSTAEQTTSFVIITGPRSVNNTPKTLTANDPIGQASPVSAPRDSDSSSSQAVASKMSTVKTVAYGFVLAMLCSFCAPAVVEI